MIPSGLLLNIRGCNASGKSTVVREYIRRYPEAENVTLADGSKVTRCSDDVWVLGRYDRADITAPGCDTYDGFAQIKRAIMELIKLCHPQLIIYEGIIYSTTAKGHIEIATIFQRYGYIWKAIYLDCKFTEIIRRLESRNKGGKYDIRLLYNKVTQIRGAYRNLTALGYDVTRIDTTALTIAQMAAIIPDVLREVKP